MAAEIASRLRLSGQEKKDQHIQVICANWAFCHTPSALFLASVSRIANQLAVTHPAAPSAHFASPGAPSVDETTSLVVV